MIAHLVAIGVLAAPVADFGEIIATQERTVEVLLVPTIAVSGPNLPLGAPVIAEPFDPSDEQPIAIRFGELLAGRMIAEIERLSVSSAGNLLGVQVDTSAGRLPIIGTDGDAVQFWAKVATASQGDAAFSGTGVSVGFSALVRLDDGSRLERTAVLVVRQL